MYTPRFVIKSLDLIPRAEHDDVVQSLLRLEEYERSPTEVSLPAAKAIRPRTYILKASRSYRIIYELSEGSVRIIDLVHQDRIRLAIRTHRKPR